MLRIAWFSPISSTKALRSAHYTRAILPRVPSDWEIEIFVDSEDWETNREHRFLGYPIYLHHRAFLRDQARPFDLFIFHVEDRKSCSFVQTAIGIWPGIVIYHDLNLNRLEQAQLEHATTGEALNRTFHATHGSEAPPVGDYLARGWSIEIFDRAYPKFGTELNLAEVIIVENERSCAELKNRNLPGRIELSAPPVDPISADLVNTQRVSLRARHGIRADEFVVGLAAQFFLEDRATLSLEAFLEAQRSFVKNGLPLARLVWLAEDEACAKRARELLARVPQADLVCDRSLVLVAGSDEEFATLLSVCDVFLAICFNALRGLPLAALKTMARGIPTLTGYFGPSAELPVGAVLPVPLGLGEREFVASSLVKLRGDPDFRERLGVGALEYIGTVTESGGVLADLIAVIDSAAEKLGKTLRHRRELMTEIEKHFSSKLYRELQIKMPAASSSLSWDSPFNGAYRTLGWASEEVKPL